MVTFMSCASAWRTSQRSVTQCSPRRRHKSLTDYSRQSFIWQEYDVHPRFPRLKHFLDFWSRNLDGKLYRVTVAHKRLITPAELRLVGNEFRVH